MKGYILVNAYSENADYLYQANRLAEEFVRLGTDVAVVKNQSVGLTAENKIDLPWRGDFCVFLDKDKYSARLIESSGVRLFNSAAAIAVCDDKMLTHVALSSVGVPMPATLSAPFCYTPNAPFPARTVENVLEKLGLPVVVKHSFGSLGKEVFLAKTKRELEDLARKLQFTPHFYQQYVAESFGRDIRVLAVGKKAVCAMERNSGGGDFRSNIALGGVGKAIPVDGELARLTEKIATALHLDYCGIDFLFGKQGYLVCEVNSNAYFQGAERATGVNVAEIYARYIRTVCRENA